MKGWAPWWHSHTDPAPAAQHWPSTPFPPSPCGGSGSFPAACPSVWLALCAAVPWKEEERGHCTGSLGGSGSSPALAPVQPCSPGAAGTPVRLSPRMLRLQSGQVCRRSSQGSTQSRWNSWEQGSTRNHCGGKQRREQNQVIAAAWPPPRSPGTGMILCQSRTAKGRLSKGHKWHQAVTRPGSRPPSAAPVPPSSHLALVELVQADGAAVDLAGAAPQRFAGMVPPCFQRRQPPPNVLLQVQLRRQSRGSAPGAGLPGEGQSGAVLTSASCSEGSCRDWRWACTITPVQSSRAISRIVFHSCCRYFCRTARVCAQGRGQTRDPRLHSRPRHRRCRQHQQPSCVGNRPRACTCTCELLSPGQMTPCHSP